MNFSEMLKKYDSGINVELGLKNANGKEDVLFSAAELFINGLNPALNAIKALIKTEVNCGLEDYTSSVHGLKGSLLNIGAARLSAKAALLEKAARSGDYGYCKENTESFLSLLGFTAQMLAAALNEYNEYIKLSESEKPDKKTADNNVFFSEKEKLREALEDFDSEQAETTLKGLCMFSCSEKTEKQLEELKTFLKNYDYEAALRTLGNLYP